MNFDSGLTENADLLLRSSRFTVGDILRKNAVGWCDQVAVAGEMDDQKTYDELNSRANRAARVFQEFGCGYGSRIAVLSENRPAYLEVFWAAAKLGILIGGLNWRLAKPELEQSLAKFEPDIVLISEQYAGLWKDLLQAKDSSPDLLNFDSSSGVDSYQCRLDAVSDTEPETENTVVPEDGLAVLFTSGTTGPPKAAVVSHRAFLARASVKFQLGLLGAERSDFIGWTPLFHMGALDPVVAVGLTGGTYYPLDGFEPEKIVEYLQQSNTGFLPLVPATIGPLIQYLEERNLGPADFPNLSYVGVMADLVPPEQIEQISRLFGARYLNSFGSTETGYPPATGNALSIGSKPGPDDLSKREGALCLLKLVDQADDTVEPGEVGELLIRGPTLFSGYLSDPQATRESFSDGWFRTGDLFVRNPDGSLDFVDRKKYLIKSGGENIYPAEIEQHVHTHCQVKECVVVRVPDDVWGEVPKLYVRCESGSSLSASELIRFLNGKVARYKLPHYIEFVPDRSFPRNTSGKIIRGEVESWNRSDEEKVRSPST